MKEIRITVRVVDLARLCLLVAVFVLGAATEAEAESPTPRLWLVVLEYLTALGSAVWILTSKEPVTR